ncbi:MAG: ribosome maturation factor RimP [Nitrospirae bacterium]|nr:ribosome maturation factor RimP [Nitrospirota bacterium]
MGFDRDRIAELVRPVVESLGMELADVEYSGSTRHGVLRLFIDREGGVSLNDCEEVSRQVSYLLDVEDPFTHAYTLEVSSPGLDRPLKRISDFEKYQGRKVKIKTVRPFLNQKVFEGKIQGVDGQTIRVQTHGQENLEIPFSEIAQARLVVEF